ncbi:DUF1000-domain-containing protein, partial [Fistulina hepatica ATCC 64428]
VYGLNLTIPEDAKNVIKPWNERYDTGKCAESQEDVDDEIIFHIPFSESVRVRAIFLKLGRGEMAPQHLRIFANLPSMPSFAEAEDMRPHVDLSLSVAREDEGGVAVHPVRPASLSGDVTSLTLFFSESVGGDLSRVYYLGFRGDRLQYRKDVKSLLEIPAANSADAALIDRLKERLAGQQSTAR